MLRGNSDLSKSSKMTVSGTTSLWEDTASSSVVKPKKPINYNYNYSKPHQSKAKTNKSRLKVCTIKMGLTSIKRRRRNGREILLFNKGKWSGKVEYEIWPYRLNWESQSSVLQKCNLNKKLKLKLAAICQCIHI